MELSQYKLGKDVNRLKTHAIKISKAFQLVENVPSINPKKVVELVGTEAAETRMTMEILIMIRGGAERITD